MLRRNNHERKKYNPKSINESGFSLVELLVVIALIGIASLLLTTFFTTTLRQYLGLQKDATAFSNLAQQSQRMTNVIRGSTDIIEAQAETTTVYAYFFPNNEYVSLIKYYLNPEKTTLYADVTPMTANPPIGTPITANLKTYTIIPTYNAVAGVNLFEYQDSTGANITQPVADTSTIKGVRITIITPSTGQNNTGSQRMSTEVALRNRKTNL